MRSETSQVAKFRFFQALLAKLVLVSFAWAGSVLTVEVPEHQPLFLKRVGLDLTDQP